MIRYAMIKPAHYHNDFEAFLYNQQAFLQLKNIELITFYALDDEHQKTIAQIHFAIDKENLQAISLPQSPFGSVDFSQHIEEDILFHFVAFIKKALLKQQVHSIQIRECIAAYRTYGSDLLLDVLQQQQFVIQQREPNHHLVADAASFKSKIHPMELKRLRKCLNAGFTFRQEPLTQITYFYEFIQTCRQQKGWNLSMTLEEVKKSVTAMPAHYKIFAVYDQEICVAACIAVLVNDHILYYFFPASRQQYQSYSPSVFLLYGMYKYCQEHGMTILDLGTSATQSLQNFKSHVGGRASEKLTLQCTLK